MGLLAYNNSMADTKSAHSLASLVLHNSLAYNLEYFCYNLNHPPAFFSLCILWLRLRTLLLYIFAVLFHTPPQRMTLSALVVLFLHASFLINIVRSFFFLKTLISLSPNSDVPCLLNILHNCIRKFVKCHFSFIIVPLNWVAEFV